MALTQLRYNPNEELRKLARDEGLLDSLVAKILPDLLVWAKKYHLAGGPVYQRGPRRGSPSIVRLIGQRVIITLATWGLEGSQSAPRWSFEGGFALGTDSLWTDWIDWAVDTFSFTTDGWDVTAETKAKFLERVRGRFEKALADYTGGKVRAAKEKEILMMPTRKGTEHFKWLVMYQVNRMSQKQIADEEGEERTTVAAGINSAAQLLIGEDYRDWLIRLPAGRPHRNSR